MLNMRMRMRTLNMRMRMCAMLKDVEWLESFFANMHHLQGENKQSLIIFPQETELIMLHHNTLAQPKLSHKPPHKIRPLCKSKVVPTQVQKQTWTTWVPKAALAHALQLTTHAKCQGCESVQYSKYMLVLQDRKCNIRSRTALRSRGTGISGLERPSIWPPTGEYRTSSKL